MKKLTLILSLSLLSGCASSAQTGNSAANLAPLRFEETVENGNALKTPSGNRYFLQRAPGIEAKSSGLLPALTELETAVKKRLAAAGYLPAKTQDHAHLRVILSEQEAHFGAEGYRFRQRDNFSGNAGQIEISGTSIITVGLFILGNGHGVRPQILTKASTRGALESFQTPTLYGPSFARILNKITLPKASPSRAKGLPGCFPSFGFQTEEVHGEPNSGELARSDEDQFQNFFRQAPSTLTFKISKIVKNGPAARAGLKVGDLLEAVDSVPYETFQQDLTGKFNSIYDGMAAVPVKYRRGEELRRSSITPKVLCYSDLE